MMPLVKLIIMHCIQERTVVWLELSDVNKPGQCSLGAIPDGIT